MNLTNERSECLIEYLRSSAIYEKFKLLEDQNKKLEEFTSPLKDAANQKSMEIESLKKDIQDKDEIIKKLTETNMELLLQLQGVAISLSNCEKNSDTLESRIYLLEEDFSEITDSLEEKELLQTRCEEADKEMKRLREINEKANDKIDQGQEMIEKLSDEKELLQTKCEEADRELKRLRDINAKANDEIDQVHALIEQLNSEKAELETNYQRAHATIDSLTTENTSLSASITKISDELNETRQTMAELTCQYKEKDQLNAQVVTEFQHQLKKEEMLKKELLDRITAVEEENLKFQKSLEEALNLKEHLQNEYNVLKTDMGCSQTELLEKIQQLTTELTSKKNELKRVTSESAKNMKERSSRYKTNTEKLIKNFQAQQNSFQREKAEMQSKINSLQQENSKLLLQISDDSASRKTREDGASSSSQSTINSIDTELLRLEVERQPVRAVKRRTSTSSEIRNLDQRPKRARGPPAQAAHKPLSIYSSDSDGEPRPFFTRQPKKGEEAVSSSNVV